MSSLVAFRSRCSLGSQTKVGDLGVVTIRHDISAHSRLRVLSMPVRVELVVLTIHESRHHLIYLKQADSGPCWQQGYHVE